MWLYYDVLHIMSEFTEFYRKVNYSDDFLANKTKK